MDMCKKSTLFLLFGADFFIVILRTEARSIFTNYIPTVWPLLKGNRRHFICYFELDKGKVTYTSRISHRVLNLVFFFGGGAGALTWRGRLFQILSLRRGANSKRGAYLKLGANSSIYGKLYGDRLHFNRQRRRLYKWKASPSSFSWVSFLGCLQQFSVLFIKTTYSKEPWHCGVQREERIVHAFASTKIRTST